MRAPALDRGSHPPFSAGGASGTGGPGALAGTPVQPIRPLLAGSNGRRRAVERSQKEKLVANLHHALAGTTCVVVTHQTGLTVAEVTDLRRQMRAAGASFKVTKNRLARRAIVGTKFEPLSPMFT